MVCHVMVLDESSQFAGDALNTDFVKRGNIVVVINGCSRKNKVANHQDTFAYFSYRSDGGLQATISYPLTV